MQLSAVVDQDSKAALVSLEYVARGMLRNMSVSQAPGP